MWRVGKFVVGRFVEVAQYQALLKQIENRLEEMKSAHHVIVNSMFENVKRDVATLMHVYEKERSIGQLLDACKGLDIRITELERKLKGIA